MVYSQFKTNEYQYELLHNKNIKFQLKKNHMMSVFKICVIFLLQELYSESYDNICVMFASIPNFKDFYHQNASNKNGIECIRVLNEILVDFDQVGILHFDVSLSN